MVKGGKKLRICVAGATGWAGRSVVAAIRESGDLELVGAVARKAAGQDLGTALGREPSGIRISPTVEQALESPTDVLIEFTRADSVKKNVMAALRKRAHVVIGSSGLGGEDFKEIDSEARRRAVGVIACGNFSITAALAKHFSLIAARHIPHWEVVDYAHADKIDVPSGTARELAERLGEVANPKTARPVSELMGPKEARGADIAGTRVHSLRLPSYVISFESIFGLPDERLSIRHDSGSGAGPYVAGALLAARKVVKVRGLIRGLDTLLFSSTI